MCQRDVTKRQRERRLVGAGLSLLATILVVISAACGGGPTPVGPNPTTLAVTSVSSTSPTPLTPLQITTSGLNTTAPVSVQFSNSAGFSVIEQPIRVVSDGMVITAVPLYADPTSGQMGPGTVSLVLTQGSQSSAPLTLTIQDLPPVSAYGTQPGQISHAFLTYAAMRAARRLNEMQASQSLPGNTVDGSQAQATLKNLLIATIEARNDVDRVSLDNSLVISAGNLPNGTPIQFDQYSLDMMDRVIGLWLTELAPTIVPVTAASPRVSSSVNTVRIRAKPTSSRRAAGPRSANALPSGSAGGMSALLASLTVAANLTGIAQAIQGYAESSRGQLDEALGILGGFSGVTGLYGLASKSTLGQVAKDVSPALGAMVSSIAVAQDFASELVGYGYMWQVAKQGNDPAKLQALQAEIDRLAKDAWVNTLQAELSFTDAAPVFGTFGPTVVKNIQNGAVLIQSSQFLLSSYQIAISGTFKELLNVASKFAAEVTTGVVAEAIGSVSVSNNQGSVLAAESGIGVSPFDVQSSQMTALGDPNGNYDLFLPLQVPNTNYANMTLSLFDPVSGTTLASATVDLSGLNTSAIGQFPALQGTCSDNDATAPDADDPDCD